MGLNRIMMRYEECESVAANNASDDEWTTVRRKPKKKGRCKTMSIE